MSRINTRKNPKTEKTHEGAPAYGNLKPIQMLRRSVLSCLLWEDEFYEDGQTIANRIMETAAKVQPADLAELAIEARHQFSLRHVPLLLLTTLARSEVGRATLANAVASTVNRVDEMAELISIYKKMNPGKMVPRQMRKGLAIALTKFDEYQLGKYAGTKRDISLRDVLRIVRPKSEDAALTALWGRAVKRELATPDTWEVALSGGADKRETFERLLREGQLGYLALLRNLRNMEQAGVDRDLITSAIEARKGARHVLPFRYVAAARAAPSLERSIDKALIAAIGDLPSLLGTTGLLVDVSGSMDRKLSEKSDLTRADAAAALAAVFPGDVKVWTFSERTVAVPPRRGMAGVDAILRSQPHSGTRLGQAVSGLANEKLARLIVITDEQSHDSVPALQHLKGYMINVASNRNGVGYGPWTHIDGFSEGVIRYIHEVESGE